MFEAAFSGGKTPLNTPTGMSCPSVFSDQAIRQEVDIELSRFPTLPYSPNYGFPEYFHPERRGENVI
jgi:hypothetical protein